MTATQTFFEALEEDQSKSALNDLLREVEKRDGALAMLRCCEHWSKKEPEMRPQLLAACDRIAVERKGEVAREAALRSVTLRDESDTDRDDAVTILLARSQGSPTHLQRAVKALGGTANAASIVKRLAKSPEIKKDAERVGELRRQLAKLFEIDDDPDRAFFEMLKAVRKAPREKVYVEETFQLALRTERYAELAAVFDALSQREDLGAKHRALYCNKLAHLLERHLDKPEDALEVYERSLLLRPKSKATRRHRQRLIDFLAQNEDNFDEESATAISTVPPITDEFESEADFSAETEIMISRSDVDADAFGNDENKTEALDREVGPSVPPPLPFEESSQSEEGDEHQDVILPEVTAPLMPVPETDSLPDLSEANSPFERSAEEKPKPQLESTQVSKIEEISADSLVEAEEVSEVGAFFNAGFSSPALISSGEIVIAPGPFDSQSLPPPLPVDDEESMENTPAPRPQDEGSQDAANNSDDGTASSEEAVIHEGFFPESFSEQDDEETALERSESTPVDVELEAEEIEAEEIEAEEIEAEEIKAEEIEAEEIEAEEVKAEEIEAEEVKAEEIEAEEIEAEEIEAEESEAEEKTAVTAKGRPRDLFAEAGTLLGGDDFEAAIECAQALLEKEERGSMALRLVGHALVTAKNTRAWPAIALRIFCDETPNHPEVGFALARDIYESAGFEHAKFNTELFSTAALHTQDRTAARALLHPLAAHDLPEGRAFVAYSSLCDSDKEVLTLLDETAETREGLRLLALMLHRAELYKELGMRDEQLEELRSATLEIAPDSEDARFAAMLAFEGPKVERETRVGFLQELAGAHQDDGVIQLMVVKKLSIIAPNEASALVTPWLKDRAHRREAWELQDLLAKESEDEGLPIRLVHERVAILQSDDMQAEAESLAIAALDTAPDDEVADLAGAFLSAFTGSVRFLTHATKAVEERDPMGLVSFLRERVARAGETLPISERVLLLERAARAARLEENDLTALKIYEEVLALDEDHIGALRATADIALQQGDRKGGILSLEKLTARLDDESEAADVHLQLAALYEDDDRPGDAMKRYRKAAAQQEHTISSWQSLLRLSRSQDERPLLLESLKQLLELDAHEDAAAAQSEVSALLFDDGDVQGAEVAAFAAIDLEPTSERVDHWLMLITHVIDAASLTDDEGELDLTFAPSAALEKELRLRAPPFVSDALSPASMRTLALAFKGTPEVSLLPLFEKLTAPEHEDKTSDRTLEFAFVTWLGVTKTIDPELAQEKRAERMSLLLQQSEGAERAALLGDIATLAKSVSDEERALESFLEMLELCEDLAFKDAPSEESMSAALEFFKERTPALHYADALVLQGERSEGDDAARRFHDAALALGDEDPERARALLQRAVKVSPENIVAQNALLDLEVELGYGADAIMTTEAILRSERSPQRRADLLVRLAELEQRVNDDDDLATNHLVQALRDDPTHFGAFEACEKLLQKSENLKGLERLYAGQLKLLPRESVDRRLVILDKLAKIRRYDLRDYEGAIEALEAINALDQTSVKSREDAARLYMQLTRYQDAVETWRQVLVRDPVNADGWRALLQVYCNTKQADEAFVIAQTVANLELADRAMVRVVKSVRPPFPRWPRAPKDTRQFKRTVAHSLERSPIRSVFEHAGAAAHRVFAKSLKDYGLKKRDRIPERQIPPSILMAVRTVVNLLGLKELPPLYQGERSDEHTPTFGVLPTREPGLVIASDVLRGGMTPERAFSLGRAMALLSDQAIVISTLDAPRIKLVLESLLARYVPNTKVEGDAESLRTVGKRMDAELFKGLSQKDERRKALEVALKDYVVARDHIHISDWIAGVGYSADRIGFLLTGDLAPAVRVLKASAKGAQRTGTRLATKELVLFTASAEYLKLRHDLGLALSQQEATPVLELG